MYTVKQMQSRRPATISLFSLIVALLFLVFEVIEYLRG